MTVERSEGSGDVARTRGGATFVRVMAYVSGFFWVFDDWRVGLVEEPFVDGMDVILDRMTQDIDGASDGVLLEMSTLRQADANALFRDTGGRRGEWTEYEWVGSGRTGWLCPSLFYYFEKPPQEFWLRMTALSREEQADWRRCGGDPALGEPQGKMQVP